MIRKPIAALLAVFVTASLASAQTPPRFRWQTGQVLLYRTEHVTFAAYAMGDTKSETRTRVHSTKRWQVLSVDNAGVGTLQMSLQALKYETVRPDGETLAFDSAQPEKSTEAMRKQFGTFLGQPLVVLRIDSQGRVLEVKDAKFGYTSATKYESDPPFKFLLPVEGFKMGQGWERQYQLTLEPPQGTGEKYPAVQRFLCKNITGNLATLTLATEVTSTPAAQEDQVPLWQMQPEGEIIFDVQAGRLQKATLRINKETKGEGASTHFQSAYTEEYAGDR
jgi:hypothetical protein